MHSISIETRLDLQLYIHNTLNQLLFACETFSRGSREPRRREYFLPRFRVAADFPKNILVSIITRSSWLLWTLCWLSFLMSVHIVTRQIYFVYPSTLLKLISGRCMSIYLIREQDHCFLLATWILMLLSARNVLTVLKNARFQFRELKTNKATIVRFKHRYFFLKGVNIRVRSSFNFCICYLHLPIQINDT